MYLFVVVDHDSAYVGHQKANDLAGQELDDEMVDIGHGQVDVVLVLPVELGFAGLAVSKVAVMVDVQ